MGDAAGVVGAASVVVAAQKRSADCDAGSVDSLDDDRLRPAPLLHMQVVSKVTPDEMIDVDYHAPLCSLPCLALQAHLGELRPFLVGELAKSLQPPRQWLRVPVHVPPARLCRGGATP